MNLYEINKTITYIFICILITGCSISNSVEKPYKFEEESFIKKPNINSKFNQYPREFNILISDDSKLQKEISLGLIANYFYYKINKDYAPKINIKKINYDKNNSKCFEGINPSKFTFIVLTDKNFNISSRCKSSLEKLNGIQIIAEHAYKIDAPKLYAFEVKEGDKEIIINHAILQNKTKAIILDQNEDEHLYSLLMNWKKSGGKVLESKKINKKNISELIPETLYINESNNRLNKVENIIKAKVNSTPRTRQDAEVLVLSTELDIARSLKPSLEYNYGERISVYLIPSWNNKDTYEKKELDLEGTIFIEMPWVVGLNQDFNINEEITRTRAFAIGYDAYEIFLLLSSKTKVDYFGLTGKITIKQSKINRKDILIKVYEGKLVPIGY